MLLKLMLVCAVLVVYPGNNHAQGQPQSQGHAHAWLPRPAQVVDWQKSGGLLPYYFLQNLSGQKSVASSVPLPAQPGHGIQVQAIEQAERVPVNPVMEHEYGKSDIKLLFVKKNTNKHEIYELNVETSLTLDSDDAFRTGSNLDVIATDSQKNTVFILAKMHGVASAEEFGILLAKHFLSQYPWVVRARISVAIAPWVRVTDQQGREHNHAFVQTRTSTRMAEVILHRDGEMKVSGGIRDLTVLKTTQSSFVDFVRDEFRTLPDNADRCLSTTVTADWDFTDLRSSWNNETKSVSGLNFDEVFRTVEDIILETFSGPVDTGVFSTSVQHTQFLMGKHVLQQISEIDEIHIGMPNRHYFDIDFSKFAEIPEVHGTGAGEVLRYVSQPSGQISSTLNRAKLNAVKNEL